LAVLVEASYVMTQSIVLTSVTDCILHPFPTPSYFRTYLSY
jgi:hypothetical protein